MSKNKIIQKLHLIDLKELRDLDSSSSTQDILYKANIIVFQNYSINHKQRLSYLKKIREISLSINNNFCIAHNLTLTIKVSREIGLIKNIIKDSHLAINLWKTILNQKLAINGLIFTYTDLALIYSDNSLNTLAIKYLKKAESLLPECEDDYNPMSKLHVAFSVVYSRMKKFKKEKESYEKIIRSAENKKDSNVLVPTFINISTSFLNNEGNIKKSKKFAKDALHHSQKLEENIYRPYIYHLQGLIYMKNKEFEKSLDCLNEAFISFEKSSNNKMIPEVIFSISEALYNQKMYSNSLKKLNEALSLNKKNKNFDLDIKILKKICSINKKNKNNQELFICLEKLNNTYDQNLKYKNELFVKLNNDSLKYLKDEFDVSLSAQKDLGIKLDMQSQKRKLVSSALQSASEKEFLNKIINKLNAEKINNQSLINLCNQRLHMTKDWNVFIKLFNDINPNFNKYLIKKCPEITESELRICNLIKMSFSAREIADILSITVRGVEQHRYRIRKKLNLQSDLTIFVQSV